jgi:hypothetical protein
MSVINAMLKKLDQRGAPRPDFGPASAAPALSPSRPARWRLPLIVTLGGAAIAVTAFADWPQAIASNLPSGAIASPLAISEPTPVAVAALAPPLAASVTSDAAISTPSAATLAAAPRRDDVEGITPRRAALPATALAASLPIPIPMPLPARIDKRSAAPAGAAALHRQATEQAQAGHSRAGLVLAREALAADPAYAPARLLAAVLEHETGATQRAIELLHDGLALQPQDKAQALLLARLQAQQGQTAAALATIDSHRLADATAQGLRGGLLAHRRLPAGPRRLRERGAPGTRQSAVVVRPRRGVGVRGRSGPCAPGLLARAGQWPGTGRTGPLRRAALARTRLTEATPWTARAPPSSTHSVFASARC